MSARILLFAIAFVLLSKSAIAIDTSDWENKGFAYWFPKPTEEWLANEAYQIMGGAYPKVKENYFQNFIDKSNQSITIIPKKPFHDITKFIAVYKKADFGNFFMTVYYLKPNAMTLTDVLDRYGLEYGEVTTKEDLSKEITYKFTENDCKFGGAESKAHKLAYMCFNKLITITFRSSDKVFVDAITFVFIPRDEK